MSLTVWCGYWRSKISFVLIVVGYLIKHHKLSRSKGNASPPPWSRHGRTVFKLERCSCEQQCWHTGARTETSRQDGEQLQICLVTATEGPGNRLPRRESRTTAHLQRECRWCVELRRHSLSETWGEKEFQYCAFQRNSFQLNTRNTFRTNNAKIACLARQTFII